MTEIFQKACKETLKSLQKLKPKLQDSPISFKAHKDFSRGYLHGLATALSLDNDDADLLYNTVKEIERL